MSAKRNPRPELLDSVALLVVDAQDSFIDTLYNKEEFLLRASFAIEAARSLRIHTIFTEQAADKLGGTNAKLLSLAPKSKVFHKKTFSALSSPGIERYLRDKEIYHLLVIGLETPICIYQTGLQAQDEDIDITFLSDALGARREADVEPVLQTLRGLECQILPSEAVYYSLLGDVTSSYFKGLNELVKAYGEKKFDEAEFKLSEDEIRRIRLEQRSNEPKHHIEPQPRSDDESEGEHEEDSQDGTRNRRDNRSSRDEGDDRNRNRRPRRRSRGNRNREGSERRDENRDSDRRDDRRDNERRDNRRTQDNRRRNEPRQKRNDEPSTDSKQSPSEPKPEVKASPEVKIDSPKPVKESASVKPKEAEAKPAKKAPKKAAKKAAKKVAKKATKKVAKKAAKKVAKKVAKKTVAEKPE